MGTGTDPEKLQDEEMTPQMSTENLHDPAQHITSSSGDTLHGHAHPTIHQPTNHDRVPTHTIISFSSTDPDHPNNWPFRRKLIIFIGGIMSVINSTLASSMPSGAIDEIAEEFNITSDLELVLPISTFLIGYFVGPILCGPLSENFGRKPVFLASFLLYTCFTLGCALAPNWPALLIFRWLCGVMASAPIAVVGGLYADIFSDPSSRGKAMAAFMAATTFGPVLGPVISGFVSVVSWRWSFWVLLILAGTTIPFIMLMPESYAPILLEKKAAALRKQTGDTRIVARSELERRSFSYVMRVVMTRPFRMLFQESIVLFTCMYLSLAYAIFYLYFEAYPIIFQGPDSIYHFNAGETGLAFLPIGVGAAFCSVLFLWYDAFLAKSMKQRKRWALIEEYRRLPLACVGGPMYVISLFWIGWSAYPQVHWIVPIMSGLTFGMGFLLIFMAMLNYLTDAYETYAASAQGIASTCRSIFGALLPLASKRMFASLGIHWACSLLAFLSLGMAVIPFVFIRYGDHIRANSKFCLELKDLKDKRKTEELQEEEGRRRMSDRETALGLRVYSGEGRGRKEPV